MGSVHHLVIRADGGSDIGYGHLVRTGAIAAIALRNGDDVTYCTKTPEAVSEVTPDDVEILTLDEKNSTSPEFWLDKIEPDIVLTDTYGADTDYQLTVTNRVLHAVLDDGGHRTICADILINGNVYAQDLRYDWIGSEPTWCLGTEYLPIRETIRNQRRDVRPVRRVPERALITMGGSDIRNTTPAAVQAFEGSGLAVTVVLGPGFTNRERIESAVDETDATIDVREDPENLPELMTTADFAVSAAGSTVYELLALGTPTIAIPQAANQKRIAEALDELNVIEHLSMDRIDALPRRIYALSRDQERRRRYREGGMTLVDCRGPARILEVLTR